MSSVQPIEFYRGLRNNNPGNISWTAFARKYGADRIETVPPGKTFKPRFAHYPTMVAGLRCQAELLIAYSAIPDDKGGLIDTIAEAIYRYCPPSGPDSESIASTESYVEQVCGVLGCKRDDEFKFENYDFLWWMLVAQGEHEQPKDAFHTYVTDAQISEAVRLALAT